MPLRFSRSWSLKTRVTVLTVVIFVISIWSLAFYVSRMLRGDMLRQLGEQQFLTISYVADGINQELAERLSALDIVARSVSPATLNNPAAIQAVLEQRPIFQRLFNAGTFVTGVDGTAIASLPLSAERLGVNYMDRDFMVSVLKEGKITISRPVVGKKLLAPIFIMAAPIRDAQGRVVGVLAGVTHLGESNFLDRLAGNYGRTGGYILVAPQHNLFVTASDKSRIMQPLPPQGINPMHDKYMQGYEGYGVAISSRGREELSAAKGIPVADWFIAAVLPTDEAFGPIREMQRRMLLATVLLTFLAGGLIAWLISLIMKRQLAPMLFAARTLAELSASDHPLQRLPVARQDEVGELINGFNRVLLTLEQRETALKESEAFKLVIMDSVAAEIAVIDRKGVILTVNQRWRRFAVDNAIESGTPSARTDVGANYLSVCQASSGRGLEIALAVHQGIEAVLEGRLSIFTIEYPCHTPQQQRWFSMLVTPFSNGAEAGAVIAHVDVTECKLAVQQLADQKAHLESLVGSRTSELTQALEVAKLADQTKDAFLANMSHELRTPLSAVIGMAGLAQSLSTDPRQQDYLNKIVTSGKHLNRIINDLLDLSKIAAGHLAFETMPFGLHALVQQCKFVMGSRAAEKGLELVETIDDAVPDVLLGDPLRIEQILLNLVGNAIKFTATGRVELRVSLHARQEGRICLVVEVEDTGVGLRPEDLGRLFKPFAQADATVSRKFGGTGLGLAISKRLAEMMDGDISVTSREGRGTTFRVKIWLGLGDSADLPGDDRSHHETPPACYDNAHVLVADDQALNREIVEALLLAVGITPRMAENGQEALDILIEGGPEAFDLVLMDIQMPVMDGLAATRALRSRPGFGSLPIMAMTAHTMMHEKIISIGAGMNGHIAKPFDNASFYRVLAKWIPAGKQKAAPEPVLRAEPPVAQGIAEKGLYRLHHIDARNGLARFNGKEDRYRHWLADFAATAGALPGQMRSDIAAGHREDAARKAHSLKGRAGMLGMDGLHSVVSTLEHALRDGIPVDELLDELAQSIKQVRDELAKFFADDAAEAGGTPPLPERMVWNESYGVGVAHLDEQHKALIAMINQLADLQSATPQPPLAAFHELLCGVFDYTQVHFKAEEDYLTGIGYAHFAAHQSEHADFIEQMTAYDMAAMAGVLDRAGMHRYLMQWVLAHILQSDMQYRHFAEEKKLA